MYEQVKAGLFIALLAGHEARRVLKAVELVKFMNTAFNSEVKATQDEDAEVEALYAAIGADITFYGKYEQLRTSLAWQTCMQALVVALNVFAMCDCIPSPGCDQGLAHCLLSGLTHATPPLRNAYFSKSEQYVLVDLQNRRNAS